MQRKPVGGQFFLVHIEDAIGAAAIAAGVVVRRGRRLWRGIERQGIDRHKIQNRIDGGRAAADGMVFAVIDVIHSFRVQWR